MSTAVMLWDIWNSYYNELQTRLSELTERIEAIENLPKECKNAKTDYIVKKLVYERGVTFVESWDYFCTKDYSFYDLARTISEDTLHDLESNGVENFWKCELCQKAFNNVLIKLIGEINLHEPHFVYDDEFVNLGFVNLGSVKHSAFESMRYKDLCHLAVTFDDYALVGDAWISPTKTHLYNTAVQQFRQEYDNLNLGGK